MTGGVYRRDPLTPEERGQLERDLISFCDRELDLLGDIRGLDVLYAGGSSLLWIEGLCERVGRGGSVTALEADANRINEAEATLDDAGLPARVRLVAGDVFGPPFGAGAFDLAYSAGLFHELDVSGMSAEEALRALASVVRPGGRVATGDFVDDVAAVQLEDEAIDAELARVLSGEKRFGIGPSARLVGVHEWVLSDVRWLVLGPMEIRHLDKTVLAEEGPTSFAGLSGEVAGRLRPRRRSLRERVRLEGYTRPATLFVEGVIRG